MKKTKKTPKRIVKKKPQSGDKFLIAKLRKENRELRDWRRRLSLILDYAKKISVKKELDPLLKLLLEQAKSVLDADRCTVFLLDKKKNELWSRVASGNQVIRVPANKGIVGEAVKTGKAINIPNAYADARFNKDVDKKTGYRTRSLLTAPMHDNRGRIIGAFQVLNKKRGKFEEKDERLLLIFAEQAATAIENSRLYEEVRSAAEDTIFRLASAAEYKDQDTRNHLERMSRYSAIISETMKMSSQWVRNIRFASPMHDIGKLGVPDAILKKPGKLSTTEWKEMEKHPVYGADILKDSDNELLQMSARVAISHHEKWDGSGYPEGLKGEKIPIEGRIVALADVFDALTSRRCYKPAFSVEKALRIIKEDSGKHFDPTCVKAFFKSLPKILKVMEEYTDDPEVIPKDFPKDAPEKGDFLQPTPLKTADA